MTTNSKIYILGLQIVKFACLRLQILNFACHMSRTTNSKIEHVK